MDANGNYKEVPVSGNWDNKCDSWITDSLGNPISTYYATIDSNRFVEYVISHIPFNHNDYKYSPYIFKYRNGVYHWNLLNDGAADINAWLLDYGIRLFDTNTGQEATEEVVTPGDIMYV
jgi:hypothetical protein